MRSNIAKNQQNELKQGENVEKLEQRIKKLEDEKNHYEENDVKSVENFEKRIKKLEDVQKFLIQPTIIVKKNESLCRRIISNPNKKWNQEIIIGKAVNYDYDKIENMQKRHDNKSLNMIKQEMI